MAPVAPNDAIERLRSTARDLVSLTTGLPPERFRRPGPDGGWGPAQVIAHLADAEQVWGVRLRMVLAQDRPNLAAYDQDRWAERFHSLDDARESLARWRVLRDAHLRLLDSVGDDEWDRAGLHEERGEITLAEIVALLAGHDQEHLAQLRRVLS